MEPYDLLVANGLVVTASDIGHYDIPSEDSPSSCKGLVGRNGSDESH